MVPVIGEQHLRLTAFPIGLLMSADGLGALLGAILVAHGARPTMFRGLYMLGWRCSRPPRSSSRSVPGRCCRAWPR